MQVAKGGVAGGKFAAKFGLRSAKKAGKISKQATQQAFVEAKAGATNAVGGFKEGGVAGATQAVGGDLMKGASNVRDKAAAANHLVGGDIVTGALADSGQAALNKLFTGLTTARATVNRPLSKQPAGETAQVTTARGMKAADCAGYNNPIGSTVSLAACPLTVTLACPAWPGQDGGRQVRL